MRLKLSRSAISDSRDLLGQGLGWLSLQNAVPHSRPERGHALESPQEGVGLVDDQVAVLEL